MRWFHIGKIRYFERKLCLELGFKCEIIWYKNDLYWNVSCHMCFVLVMVQNLVHVIGNFHGNRRIYMSAANCNTDHCLLASICAVSVVVHLSLTINNGDIVVRSRYTFVFPANSLSFLLFLKDFFLGQINDDQWIVFDKWTYLVSNANTFVFLLEQINFQLYQSNINLSWMVLFQSYWNVNSRACRRKVEWQQTVLESNYLYSKSYMHIGCRSCVYLTSNIVLVVVIIFVRRCRCRRCSRRHHRHSSCCCLCRFTVSSRFAFIVFIYQLQTVFVVDTCVVNIQNSVDLLAFETGIVKLFSFGSECVDNLC